MAGHKRWSAVWEAVIKKLEEKETPEQRLVALDWLIGRLFQMKAQIGRGDSWPPMLEEQ